MKGPLHDLKQALRRIRRHPVPSAAIIATLALGIGPATAVFATVYGTLLRPLPYDQPDNLLRLRQPAADGTGAQLPFSVPELADYRERVPLMSGLVEYHTLWFNLIEDGEPERVQTGIVSWNYFEVLGVRPLHGRTFTAADDEVGAPRVLVLSHEYWQSRYGGDPAVVGRIVDMNQHPHEIVGVLPAIPRYPDPEDEVYMPGSACPFRTPAWVDNRNARAVVVFGRVAPGASVDRAQEQLRAAARGLKEDFPGSFPENRSFELTATPILDELTSDARTTLFLLFGTAAFVLLIVCANVANLTLARLVSRDRDLSLMTALGAPRWVIARQTLAESVLLSLLGGALGLVLALATTGFLSDFAGRFSPRSGDIALDGPVLLFALGASIATGLLVGVMPALRTARDPVAVLRDGGQKGSGGGMRLRSGLVIGQIALCFVLLSGAGLTMKSLVRLQAVDAGIDASRVLTLRIELDFSRYTAVGRTRSGLDAAGPAPIDFWTRLLDELDLVPAVQARGMASNVPFGDGIPQTEFAIQGRDNAEAALVNWNVVSDGYFATVGVPLLRGRDFHPMDAAGAPGVALISQQLAQQYWGPEDPVGSRISTGGENWIEVVGVVADVRQAGLEAAPTPQVYLSIRQSPGLGSTLMVRTAGDPRASFPAIREAVRRVDPLQPVAFVQTLEEVRHESLAQNRLTALLLGAFAFLALGISAVGIAGVMAYSVSRRTREIGIRLAVGATPQRVRWMILRDALGVVVVGISIGALASLALSRTLAGHLPEFSTVDPVTFVGVSIVLAGVGILAASAPAARSAALNPLEALRRE